jgi:hypothetical protein
MMGWPAWVTDLEKVKEPQLALPFKERIQQQLMERKKA